MNVIILKIFEIEKLETILNGLILPAKSPKAQTSELYALRLDIVKNYSFGRCPFFVPYMGRHK